MSDLADLTLSERIGWAADMMHPENEIWMPILAAARQRLRLSRQPCQTCGGTGKVSRDIPPYPDYEFSSPDVVTCPACNGSGGEWPAGLVEAVAVALMLDEGDEAIAIAVLDAVESWMEAGE